MKKIILMLAVVVLLMCTTATANASYYNYYNYYGSKGTSAKLDAEDFGVVNYEVSAELGVLKGYTAGFSLTGATLENAKSVVVKLYHGYRLLQVNTATDKFKTEITGVQFSSPFDIFGTFDYEKDGYWINFRRTEYGQHLIPTRVVAHVRLANNRVLMARNINLTGDPATIYPEPIDSSTLIDKRLCANYGWTYFVNPSFKNQGHCVSYVAKKFRIANLYLYEKDPSDWTIVEGGAWGKLIYWPIAKEFKYNFSGSKLEKGMNYSLIYYPDPWPGNNLICLGFGTGNRYGRVYIKGSVDTGTLTDAKIWLVKSDDVDCEARKMINWNPTEYLFENNLITYTKFPN